MQVYNTFLQIDLFSCNIHDSFVSPIFIFRVFCIRGHHSWIKGYFYSSFSICTPFISFSHLGALAGSSNAMLDICDGSSQPFTLVTFLIEKAFNPTPLSIALTVGFL